MNDRFSHLAGDLGVGEAFASHWDRTREKRSASFSCLWLPVVIAESLLIEVTEKMKRFDANIGSVDAALQEAPEVLKAIGVDVTIDVFDGVIDDLMGIVASQSA